MEDVLLSLTKVVSYRILANLLTNNKLCSFAEQFVPPSNVICKEGYFHALPGVLYGLGIMATQTQKENHKFCYLQEAVKPSATDKNKFDLGLDCETSGAL